jgi:hypothetical protein
MRYTISDIASVLEADSINRPGDWADAHRRVRGYATRELLEGGKVVDRRGTVDFPVEECFRAALLDALSAHEMNHYSLAVICDAGAEKLFQARFAPSQHVGGVAKPEGGFLDAVRGVAAGEQWDLRVCTYAPAAVELEGFLGSRAKYVRFEWAGDQIPLDRYDGSKPRTELRVDLTALWSPIVSLVKLNEAA